MSSTFYKILITINRNEWVLFFPLAVLTHFLFIHSTDFLNSDTACLLNDSWLIHNLAKSYAETGMMTMAGEPTLYQFPVYPLYISMYYKFFGVDPRFILYSQLFLSVIFVNMSVIMTRSILGNFRFLLGIFLCFDLHLLLYSSCLLTELWVMIIWLLALYVYFQYRSKKKVLYWCLSIVIFTLSANIKPLSLFLPLFMIFGLGLFDSKNIWHNFKLIVLGCLIFVVGMQPLLYRNYLISDQYPLLTTNSALAIWYYNLPYARAKLEGREISELRIEHVEKMRQYLLNQGEDIPPVSKEKALSRHDHRKALGLNEFEYAVIANKLSTEYMKKNFFSYALLHLKSGLSVFTASNLSWLKLAYTKYDAVSFNNINFKTLKEWWASSDPKFYFFMSRIYELCYSLGFLLFALIGCVTLTLKKQFTILHWAGWLIIIYVICITGLNTWGRFRFLFMPILIYLGVEGLKNLVPVFWAKKRVETTSFS